MLWVIPNNPVEQNYMQLHPVNMCIRALYYLSALVPTHTIATCEELYIDSHIINTSKH